MDKYLLHCEQDWLRCLDEEDISGPGPERYPCVVVVHETQYIETYNDAYTVGGGHVFVYPEDFK